MSEEKMLAVKIVSHEGAGRLEVCEVARPSARLESNATFGKVVVNLSPAELSGKMALS